MVSLSDEILALRTEFMADRDYRAASYKQIHGLRKLVAEAVGEENRLPVIQLVTGLELRDLRTGECSTKLLTQHTFSTLIDWWLVKDPNGKIVRPWRLRGEAETFLREAKAALEARSGAEPWRVDPRGL